MHSAQDVRSNQRLLVEVGVIFNGSVATEERESLATAIAEFVAFLEAEHTTIRVEVTQHFGPDQPVSTQAQPSNLLQDALEKRDVRKLDYVFVITSASLASYYSTRCFAALSRPLDAAVISYVSILPERNAHTNQTNVSNAVVAHRLSRLMLHALGHLSGLSRSDKPDNLMYHPAHADDLDRMQTLDPEQIQRQNRALEEVADQRLEEAKQQQRNRLPFAGRAAWINRREIAEAIVAARPWEFPVRLSGLTLASVSTVVILFMTAEAWDLALAQSAWRVLLLVVASCVFTTGYVIVRQQLVVRASAKQSEQGVVTVLAALGIVLGGLVFTWSALTLVGLAIGSLLFPAELISQWAESSDQTVDQIGVAARLKMSLVAASLGLLIGALGASFEAQHYFRHVIFVDEEI